MGCSDPYGEDIILKLRDASPRKTAGASVADRKGAEKRARLEEDGRSKRATGRTAQLGVRLRPEMLEAIKQEADTRDVLVVEVIEAAWDAYVKSKRT